MKEFPAYAVLNCHVTQVLGLYATAEEAGTAAKEFGRCSFAHHLSAGEQSALAAQRGAAGTPTQEGRI